VKVRWRVVQFRRGESGVADWRLQDSRRPHIAVKHTPRVSVGSRDIPSRIDRVGEGTLSLTRAGIRGLKVVIAPSVAREKPRYPESLLVL